MEYKAFSNLTQKKKTTTKKKNQSKQEDCVGQNLCRFDISNFLHNELWFRDYEYLLHTCKVF